MTPTQVDTVLACINRLFPRSKLTGDEMDNFGEALLRIEIDNNQAEAVIENHRNQHDYASPKLSELLKLMTAAQQAKRIQSARASSGNKIIDRYRRAYGAHGMTDTDVAMRVARLMQNGTIKIRSHDGSTDSQYTDSQIRQHLIDVMSEFMDKQNAEDLAYQYFPDDVRYGKIIERRNRVNSILRSHDDSRGNIKISDLMKAVVRGERKTD